MNATQQRDGDRTIGDADLSVVGSLLADRGRCRVLLALADGRALPASMLADEAGVSPATASTHLRRLVDGQLLTVTPRGRYRYYSLAGPHVAELIEVLARLAPSQPVRSLREGTQAHAMRYARRCYDHLAGRVGVAVTEALIEQGLLTVGFNRACERGTPGAGRTIDPAGYALTAQGSAALKSLGVAQPASSVVVCCVDWTEQRHHVRGPLGRALLDRFMGLGWLEGSRRGRALRLTAKGVRGLRTELGVVTPESSAIRS